MGEMPRRSSFWADVRELMGVGAVGVLLVFMAAEIFVSPLSILAWFGLIYLIAFAVAAAAVALLLRRESPRPRLWSAVRILIAGAGAVVLVVISVWRSPRSAAPPLTWSSPRMRCSLCTSSAPSSSPASPGMRG